MSTTLQEYLNLIADIEDGLIEVTPEKLGIVFDGLKNKIDGYVELIEYMQERASALKSKAKKINEKAKALENAEKRIRAYIAFLLDINEAPEIYGHTYKVGVRRTYQVEMKEEPTEENQAKYPELMRQKITYEWDKARIKEILQTGPIPIAELKENLTTRIGIRK